MKKGQRFINKNGVVIEIIEEADKLNQIIFKIRNDYKCVLEDDLISCIKANGYKEIK